MAQGGWRGGLIAIEIGNLSLQKKVGHDVLTPVETLRRGQGDSSREGWGVPHMQLAFLAPPVTLSLFLSHIPIVMAFSRNNFSL